MMFSRIESYLNIKHQILFKIGICAYFFTRRNEILRVAILKSCIFCIFGTIFLDFRNPEEPSYRRKKCVKYNLQICSLSLSLFFKPINYWKKVYLALHLKRLIIWSSLLLFIYLFHIYFSPILEFLLIDDNDVRFKMLQERTCYLFKL